MKRIKQIKEQLKAKHLITYEDGVFSKADLFYVHLPQISKNMEITDSKTWDYLKKKPIEIKYKNVKLFSDINNNPEISGYKLCHVTEVTKSKPNKSLIRVLCEVVGSANENHKTFLFL